MKYKYIYIVLLLLCPIAKADTIFDYQGGVMSGCSCALTGSVTLSADNVLAYDFTDGTHTLTNLDSTGYLSPLGAFQDPTQPPFSVSWFIHVTSANGWGILIDYYGSAFEATDASGQGVGESPLGAFGYLQGHPGVWTDPPVPTPEPSTGLMVLGAGVFLFLKKVRFHLTATPLTVPLGFGRSYLSKFGVKW